MKKGGEEVIEVRVKLVGFDQRREHPVVVLEEVGGDRYLSLSVGPAEAAAIELKPTGDEPHHLPHTHDLLLEVVHRFGGKLRRAIITDCRHDTFYAALELEGTSIPGLLECRPSDAIALATRSHAPIYVTEAVAAQAMRRIPRYPRPPDHPPAAG